MPATVGVQQAPDLAKLWVLRAFITPERATSKYGFGWDEKTQRVVVPVLHNGDGTGLWTARAVDGRSPKYLMPKGSVGAAWYDTRPGGSIVICEDVLSAARCTEAGYSAAAILGTTVGVQQLQRITSAVKEPQLPIRILGWFDADAAGRKAWVQLRKSCGVLGLNPIRVQSDKDPKLHTRKQIQEIVHGVLEDHAAR